MMKRHRAKKTGRELMTDNLILMRRLGQFSMILEFMILGVVLFETDASAYLDPGIGSYVLQVVAASIVAVAFFARKFWSRITSFFSRTSANSEDGKKQ